MVNRPKLDSELLPPEIGQMGGIDYPSPEGDEATADDTELGDPVELEDGTWVYGSEEGLEEDEELDESEEIDLAKFFENMAGDEKLMGVMHTDFQTLIDNIKLDFEAREPRDKQQEEGIKRTGLGKDAPGGAEFEGASRAVHPILTMGCIDFSSKVIKEIMPSSGPVRTKIIGEQTKEKVRLSDRKRVHMNWQLTDQVKEFRRQLEVMLSQLPLGGSQYLQWWYENGRARVQFMPIDDVVLPFSAVDFDTASRISVRELTLAEFDFQNRVEAGLYTSPDTLPANLPDEQSESAKATEKVEGKEDPGSQDGIRPIVTCYCWFRVPSDKHSDGELAPYTVALEWESGRVVGFKRNWDPLEETGPKERMDWLVQFDFIPWRGAIAIGLGQIIGSLSGSITGALRALLDSAHINNSATLIKLKGANFGGQSQQIDITQIAEIEGPVGADDIKKLAMPLPFNQPSEVLFKLMDWLVQQGQQALATADHKIADAGPNTPVGTIMTLVEQGSAPFSAIHARTHVSMHNCLSILHRINKFWLDDEITLGDLGELIVRREDYAGPMDVIPVSDPAIFSETQRVTQLQAVLDLRQLFPGMMIERKILKRALEILRIPDIDDILPAEQKPSPQDPIQENVAMFMGTPAFAFPDQDHEAHMQVHLSFAMDPQFGSNQTFAMGYLPNFVEHIKQHIGFWYVSRSLDLLSSVAGVDMSEVNYDTPESQDALARLMAESAPMVMQESQRVLGQIGPMLAQANEVVQKLQQSQMQQQMMMAGKEPPDPSKMAEVERKTQRDQADLQIKGQELQMRGQDSQMDNQVKMGGLQMKGQELQFKGMEAQGRAAESGARAQGEQAKTHQAQLELQRRSTMDAATIRSMDAKDRREELVLQLRQLADSQGIQLDEKELQVRVDEMDMKHLINQEDNLTAVTIAEKRLRAGKAPGVTTGSSFDRY
tara:strand:+ start:40 stop:2865 length:2826 start_codon:yes stop_codon:yes gene_type:complete